MYGNCLIFVLQIKIINALSLLFKKIFLSLKIIINASNKIFSNFN